MSRSPRTVDVLVVGAGPAGLTVGARLAAEGAGTVEIIEREQRAGGIPRHCDHNGFPMSGPEFARRAVNAARHAGASVRVGVTVTGWAGPLSVDITGPAGLERVTARAVVLATGARERPRSARLIPGTRPAGVLTTGELQQAVHLHHQRVGTRAVVVGAEPIGLKAVRTLRRAGVAVAALIDDGPGGRDRRARGLGVPVLTGVTVAELFGRGRLAGVELRREDGSTFTVRCDTVVLTGDRIPDHELARRGGITLDPATKGPAVDTAFRTSRPGVFAVGSLLHGVEAARTAARQGRDAAAPVLRHLADEPWPA